MDAIADPRPAPAAAPPSPDAVDEDLRRACRELDCGLGSWRHVVILGSTVFYGATAVAVHQSLTLGPVVRNAVVLMSIVLVLSTVLALHSLQSMSRSLRILDQALDLPRRLYQLRAALEAGPDGVRRGALASFNGHLGAGGPLPDRRVAAAVHRLRAVAAAGQRRLDAVRAALAMPRAAVDDGYVWRSGLRVTAQILLYSGIIATLYGLYVSFNDEKLKTLAKLMFERHTFEGTSRLPLGWS